MQTAKETLLTVSALILILLVFCFNAHKCLATEEDQILGRWRDVSGKVEVEIYKIKNKYSGKIVWLKEPNYRENDRKGMAGKPRVDRENPDPDMRTRPLMNMDLFWDCVFTESRRWEKGVLYDPLKGKKYQCSIFLETPDRIRVRGYVGVEILGKTIFLKRASL